MYELQDLVAIQEVYKRSKSKRATQKFLESLEIPKRFIKYQLYVPEMTYSMFTLVV